MTPDFAIAVDPVFLHVLGFVDRISQGENPPPREERQTVQNFLRQAEAQLGQRQDWELAKYALVCWIDDLLIEAPWEGRNWWKENALEVEAFNTRVRATEFFVKANNASNLTRRDALEVFYVCVVLGFRGLYRDPQGGVPGRPIAAAAGPGELGSADRPLDPAGAGPAADCRAAAAGRQCAASGGPVPGAGHGRVEHGPGRRGRPGRVVGFSLIPTMRGPDRTAGETFGRRFRRGRETRS